MFADSDRYLQNTSLRTLVQVAGALILVGQLLPRPVIAVAAAGGAAVAGMPPTAKWVEEEQQR